MNIPKNKSIRVKADTHRKFKVAAAQAELSHDEYQRYLLELGKAYPPTIDYKPNEKPQS